MADLRLILYQLASRRLLPERVIEGLRITAFCPMILRFRHMRAPLNSMGAAGLLLAWVCNSLSAGENLPRTPPVLLTNAAQNPQF